MWIKKVNLAVFLVCALVVGYGACALVGTLSADGSLLSGDIAKADLYSGQKMDPDVAVVEERLQNDTAFLKQTQEAMALLKQRLDTLNDLTDRTMSLCSGVAEFESVMSGISSLQVKAHNASLALERTAEELQKVADGKKSTLYEQASNNAYIGFLKTENQLGVGKDFVETATKYIDKNADKVSEDIARLVADWTVYCAEDAVMNGSEDETAYWLSSAEKMNGVFSNAENLGARKLASIMKENVGGKGLTAINPHNYNVQTDNTVTQQNIKGVKDFSTNTLQNMGNAAVNPLATIVFFVGFPTLGKKYDDRGITPPYGQ